MAVRNFWLDAQIDGRHTHLTGGPQSKDGGFRLVVMVRQDGGKTKALEIRGRALNGELELVVDHCLPIHAEDDRGFSVRSTR